MKVNEISSFAFFPRVRLDWEMHITLQGNFYVYPYESYDGLMARRLMA